MKNKLNFNYSYFLILLEYVSACRNNGNASPDHTLQEAFKLFDLDNDGTIDFEEFTSAMKFLGQAI